MAHSFAEYANEWDTRHPCISSVHNRDPDYYFELLREEERDTQPITRCCAGQQRDIRDLPRANRICSPARNPIAPLIRSVAGRELSTSKRQQLRPGTNN